jgi:tripeptide aminopeptidase
MLGTAERRYLNDIFAELCAIESPSRRERACAQRVTQELAALGIETVEDDAAAVVGSDCGNLLARIDGTAAMSAPGAQRPSVLLCAHLDTVPLAAPVQPVVRDGAWENENDGILGADNKAAVAMLLALARTLRRDGSPLDVELLFTVGEEISLAGSRAFDTARLRSPFGYVFDHATPIGGVVMGSPTHYRVDAEFRGAAAHAGIRPEDGRSAIVAAASAIASMRHGRIDEETTVNVGRIEGGSAINVVPERCSVLAEVRSLDAAAADGLAAEIVDRVHEAANDPAHDCDVDVSVERTFEGYRLSPGAHAVRVAEAALRACGYEPEHIASGGGSDANALIVAGVPTVNLANGTERNHEPDERVTVAALEGMLDVVHALVREAGTVPVVGER